jgi:RimJ/RimL family protein N-acetyltransferase
MTGEQPVPDRFPALTVSLPELTLRPFTLADAPAVARACNDETIQRWLPLPSPYTAEVARDWCGRLSHALLESGDGLPLAMSAGGGELIGSVSLKKTDWRTRVTEVGYWTAPWRRGEGHATAATAFLARWALGAGMERVELTAATGNTASQRVAEKAGFRFEGIMRSAGIVHGGRVDLCLYAMTADRTAEMPPGAQLPRSPQELVREFHARIDPAGASAEQTSQLRRAFLAEEYAEYLAAEDAGDRVKIADALGDLVYVAYGTALSYGMDLDAIVTEVHASNMTKDRPGTPGGKAVKGGAYREPDIAAVLARGRDESERQRRLASQADAGQPD